MNESVVVPKHSLRPMYSEPFILFSYIFLLISVGFVLNI